MQLLTPAQHLGSECVRMCSVLDCVRMCSISECVLLLQNVFSYYRMCSLTKECVLLLQNVFSDSCAPGQLYAGP